MKKTQVDKVIVLGIDGLDPNILERLMEIGDVPAFTGLRDTGTYRRLTTLNPSQSPVVWSSIATGNNPGHHGVFDFITRQPANYLPVHSIVKVNPTNLLARRGSMFLAARKGLPFWTITSQAGIPTSVIRWPVTFPPEEVRGHMLSGMGVLDLQGSAGRYAYYITGTMPVDPERKGDIIPVSSDNGEMKSIIKGPSNSRIPLGITVAGGNSEATLNVDGKKYTLRPGEWSDWVQPKFSVGPLRHVTGNCRFFLESISPLRLYLTSIQVDPEKPAFIISYPDEYATELARDIGSYNTLGIPEDTNALVDGCLDDEAFLTQCEDIMGERERMFWRELEHFKQGLLAFVFDTTDRIQHVYWRTRDTGHPAYSDEYAKKYGSVIEDYYRHMDGILGKLLESVDQQTAIYVLSDHGFTSYRKSIHLNSWLVQNGLMTLKSPAQDSQGDPLFKNVMWEKTAAYALGFSSVYLNLKGREGKGIVNTGQEAEQLKKKVADILTGLKDPETGQAAIRNVYDGKDLFSGAYFDEAPDLVVGFEPNYRASWQTAIGGAPPTVMDDNKKKWSGDHILDGECIPGIFLSNQKTSVQYPKVIDIAPTVLACFQIPQPDDMEGNSLLG